MKGLIISSGCIGDYDKLKKEIERSDFIICADGGIDNLLKLNIKPDLVLGDLDSTSETGLNYIKEKAIKVNLFPSIKDDTDTALAVEYLLDKEFDEITLMGVTGTRLDHTMANILLLNTLLEKGVKGKIIDDNNIIQLIDDELMVEYKENSYVSIIPITEDGIIVSLEGFYYNLCKEKIEFASSYGISNKIIKDYGKIKIHSGKALVFISND